jgi:hypothetical protein
MRSAVATFIAVVIGWLGFNACVAGFLLSRPKTAETSEVVN